MLVIASQKKDALARKYVVLIAFNSITISYIHNQTRSLAFNHIDRPECSPPVPADNFGVYPPSLHIHAASPAASSALLDRKSSPNSPREEGETNQVIQQLALIESCRATGLEGHRPGWLYNMERAENWPLQYLEV